MMLGGRTNPTEESQDVLRRLASHGVPLQDYGTIKRIVAFALPQSIFFLSRQFEHRTINQILQQIEHWKTFLAKDFILLPEQKTELNRWVLGVEALTWQALIGANFPQVGPWTLGLSFVPTGQGKSGPTYIFPGQRITALNRDTKATKEVIIPGDALNDPARFGAAYRKAFEDLGIWDALQKDRPNRGLISARKPQGWPVFTHQVIPRLYEYLIPYYKKPGHFSDRIDSLGHRRDARFPQDLLRDILGILRMEHPNLFTRTTIPQLKSIVQKHLDRKAKSTKSKI